MCVNVLKKIANDKFIIEQKGEYFIATKNEKGYDKVTKLEGDIDFIIKNFSDENLNKL